MGNRDGEIAALTPARRLVLLSFLMLFVELALIRWTGSNVIYLSYFSNFVLLGSFLGIGVGFLRARAKTDLFRWASTALAFLVAFVLVFPVEVERTGADIIFFGKFQPSGLPIWLTLPAIFLAVAAVMAMIGEGVARTFAQFPPLQAYRLDLIGSIVGIALFSLLSFLHAPPVVWGAVAGSVFLILYRPRLRLLQVFGILALVVMLGRESVVTGDSWSPYYKVSQFEVGSKVRAVNVNGIPHQVMMPLGRRRRTEPVYFLPYQRAAGNPLGNILIVGAGTGSDVAIALAQGARHVDAVEIDPRIQEIGRELNPDRPYASPNVDVYIDDGRAFLQRSTGRYDLILFALPDSLTLVAGQSSLRLESYLFTLEAMKEAREHLRPGGAFAMYNWYRHRWLVDRLGNTLSQAYGHPPCLDLLARKPQLALLTVGREPAGADCAEVWTPGRTSTASALQPARDDRPFVYLQERTIPSLYLVAIALILIASLALVRGVGGPIGPMRSYLDLFFMGAAFLLLETKSVVQFALLFGTTWFVNALVFAGILVSVLAAVEVSRRIQIRKPAWLYAVLFGALGVAWLVPQSSLLELPTAVRFGAAVALAFTPIFAANLIFAERFRAVSSSTVAFGANLLGAMVGGVLEYASLVTGYRALLALVAILYGLAFLFGRPDRQRASGAELEARLVPDQALTAPPSQGGGRSPSP